MATVWILWTRVKYSWSELRYRYLVSDCKRLGPHIDDPVSNRDSKLTWIKYLWLAVGLRHEYQWPCSRTYILLIWTEVWTCTRTRISITWTQIVSFVNNLTWLNWIFVTWTWTLTNTNNLDFHINIDDLDMTTYWEHIKNSNLDLALNIKEVNVGLSINTNDLDSYMQ